MVEITFKTCPDDLVTILGDHIISFESLKTQYENFKDRPVEMNEATAQTMRFNNYVESQIVSEKLQTRLLSLSVNQLILGVPDAVRDLEEGQRLVSKLYFQTYQFIVNGEIMKIEDTDSGYKRVYCNIDFTPELVEIIDDYFFRMSFKKE